MKVTKKTKIYLLISAAIMLLVVVALLYVYKNVPLRTALYRHFAKQTCFIISENDTVYSFGYSGVQKYLDKDGTLSLIAENDDFCKNIFVGHLIGRCGVINGNYLYTIARTYLPGNHDFSKDAHITKGKLIIMNKNDLSIIDEIDEDYIMIDAKISKDNLIVSGIKGFNIYDISDPSKPKIKYAYRDPKFSEFQGVEIIDNDSIRYVAFARFAEGLSIYDITDPSDPKLVANKAICDTMNNGSVLPTGLQVFTLKFKSPYLYSSLGPVSTSFGTANDRRGIMVYDLSELPQIKQQAILIPEKEWYTTKTGDPQPSYIGIHDKKIYTNFGEKGIASFSIDSDTICFEGTIDIAKGKMILPIHISENGKIYTGSFDSPKIYSYN